MPTEAAFSWGEVLAIPGVGAALAMCWLFLKHLKDQRTSDDERDKRKDATLEKISSEFSGTVRHDSTDVQTGLDKRHETTSILLNDSREREAKLHQLIHQVASAKAKD